MQTQKLLQILQDSLQAEAINSAIEAISDLVSPEYNESIKQTKDLAAGAVLIMAIVAVIIGLIIFIPKIIPYILNL